MLGLKIDAYLDGKIRKARDTDQSRKQAGRGCGGMRKDRLLSQGVEEPAEAEGPGRGR